MSQEAMLKLAYEKGLIDFDEFERFVDYLVEGRMFILPPAVVEELGAPDRARVAQLRKEEDRLRIHRWIAASRRQRRRL